ncbi:18058_t:CDS:2, partial [Cetraspora pellucida]
HKNSEIEMVLFVLTKPKERDSETQAVFEKDRFYSVGGKIVPGYYEGKKRPKMIVSISTGVTIFNKAVVNDKNAIFKVIVSNYVGQNYDFIIKVIFPYSNSWFSNLNNTICLLNSLIFVVGQMEIIDDDFYIYAKEVNYINTYFSSKQNVFEIDSSNLFKITNSTRLKLLSTHRNITENSKEVSDVEVSPSMISGNLVDKIQINFLNDFVSPKHVKVESLDESITDANNNELQLDDAIENDIVSGETKGVKKKRQRNVNSSKKEKSHVSRPLRSA